MNGFMPRIGLAWRLDDKTAVRAGYGRFIVPASLSNSERDTLGEIDLGGFTPTTTIIAPSSNNYVPVALLCNPFPTGLNPITGKSLGRNTLLGSPVTFDQYELKPPISDRFNLSVQRELPGRIIADVGYMVNFVSRDYYNRNLNMADPRLSYTYQAALNTNVANPFYGYGDLTTFPGTLRNQANVTVGSLLVPYPQYGTITQTSTNLRKARYHVLLLRLQRSFSKGVSFLLSYANVRTRSQWYWDAQDEYDNNLSWFDYAVSQSGGGGNPQIQADPRHRFTGAFTVDLPFGRGRPLGREMGRGLDAVIGGWQLAGSFTYNLGAPIVFTSALNAPTSVTQLNQVGGADKYWFQTKDAAGANLFASATSYTRRSNPWTYDGLNLPTFGNLDLSVSKSFKLHQRVKMRLRLDAFNALNHMNWAAPNLSVSSADFGRTNTQFSGYAGRQLQYSARLEF
jgi:hypothetical protein